MKHQRGLGLVELLIAVAVLGIIAAVAAPSFSDMLNRRRVQAVATTISADMAYLRAEQSLRSQQELDLYVNPNPAGRGTSCYAIGIWQTNRKCDSCWNPDSTVCTGFSTTALPIKVERLPTSTNVSFAASTANPLKFDPPQLFPNPSNFSFEICGASRINPRPVLRVELNAAGRAKICSPNSSMGGYGTCSTGTALQCPTS